MLAREGAQLALGARRHDRLEVLAGELVAGVVMEKRAEGWRYQPFNADRTVNVHDGPDRCAACHQSQAHQDFVFTLDRMKSAR